MHLHPECPGEGCLAQDECWGFEPQGKHCSDPVSLGACPASCPGSEEERPQPLSPSLPPKSLLQRGLDAVIIRGPQCGERGSPCPEPCRCDGLTSFPSHCADVGETKSLLPKDHRCRWNPKPKSVKWLWSVVSSTRSCEIVSLLSLSSWPPHQWKLVCGQSLK